VLNCHIDKIAILTAYIIYQTSQILPCCYVPGGHDVLRSPRLNYRVLLWSLSFCWRSGGLNSLLYGKLYDRTKSNKSSPDIGYLSGKMGITRCFLQENSVVYAI